MKGTFNKLAIAMVVTAPIVLMNAPSLAQAQTPLDKDAFERGLRDGQELRRRAPRFGLPIEGNDKEIPNDKASPQNKGSLQKVEPAGLSDSIQKSLGDRCISYKAEDLRKCALGAMQASLEIAAKFKEHGTQNFGLSGVSLRTFQTQVDGSCERQINRNAETFYKGDVTPRTLGAAFDSAQRCLHRIDSLGTRYGVDFAPNAAKWVDDLVNDARKGQIRFDMFGGRKI